MHEIIVTVGIMSKLIFDMHDSNKITTSSGLSAWNAPWSVGHPLLGKIYVPKS